MNNICFNERQDIWTTKYDWVPTVSENINGDYFSIGGSNDYDDSIFNNEIWSHKVTEAHPTQWFDQQHPFEFEFVVNEPQGVHKIIENLQILSNNVQPEQLTFEIIGDVYQFNKERISHLSREKENFTDGRIKSSLTNKNEFNIPNKTIDDASKVEIPGLFKNKSQIKHFSGITWDQMLEQFPELERNKRTKQLHIKIPQECRNIETFGRRLGNIYYKEDSWYTNVEPIIFDARLNDPKATEEQLKTPGTKFNSTRIRDKWCKIKVRYTGEDLAIITAIRTIMNV